VGEKLQEIRPGEHSDRLAASCDDDGIRSPSESGEDFVERLVGVDRGQRRLHRGRDVLVKRIRILEDPVEKVAILE
jgi:hypothetical protein